MSDSFNHDFYVTAATVIPLFYITLFLQDQVVQDTAKRTGSATTRNFKIVNETLDRWFKREFRNTRPLRLIRAVLMVYILTPIMYLIMAATFVGIVAEAYSLWALFYRADSVIMRTVVLWSALGLLALMCAKPTVTIMRGLFWTDPQSTIEENPDSDVPVDV